MSKAKTKNSTLALSGDECVIRACIEYTALTLAISGAFRADPSGDCTRAENFLNTYDDKREATLARACGRANTLEAIDAKARVARVVLTESGIGLLGSRNLEGAEVPFLLGLADDLVRFAAKQPA